MRSSESQVISAHFDSIFLTMIFFVYYSQLSFKRPPLVQEKVVAYKTNSIWLINKTVIYKVIAYGKWSLKRVVVKRELTVFQKRQLSADDQMIVVTAEARCHDLMWDPDWLCRADES